MVAGFTRTPRRATSPADQPEPSGPRRTSRRRASSRRWRRARPAACARRPGARRPRRARPDEGAEEPPVGDRAERAELRRHRHRGRVRRGALDPVRVVRAGHRRLRRARPGPAPSSGWCRMTRQPRSIEVRAPTRRASPPIPPPRPRACPRTAHRPGDEHASVTRHGHTPAPTANAPAASGEVARLRVREVEAREHGRHRDRDAGCEAAVDRHPAQQDERDGQEPPVDARVPEERVHAEERPVGVRRLDARVPEHAVRRPPATAPTAAKRIASATWATNAARRPAALQPSWADPTAMNPNGR